MREIKFRAWDVNEKKMGYSEPLFSDADYGGAKLTALIEDSSFPEGGKVIIMQYTCLKDKNGKEIYDGDIVRINHPQDWTGDFTNKLGRVFWWDEEGGWYHGHESVKGGSGRPPKRMWEYCEVIGNIYEDPELLNDPL